MIQLLSRLKSRVLERRDGSLKIEQYERTNEHSCERGLPRLSIQVEGGRQMNSNSKPCQFLAETGINRRSQRRENKIISENRLRFFNETLAFEETG